MLFLSRLFETNRNLPWLLAVWFTIPAVFGFLGHSALESRDADWGTAKDYEALDSIQNSFTTNLSNLPTLLVVESDNFFQPERIRALWEAVAAVEEAEDVHGTVWMGSVPHVSLFGQTPVLPGVEASDEDMIDAADRVAEHPLIKGHLLSEDRKTLLIGFFAWHSGAFETAVKSAREKLEPHGMTVRLTGPIALYRAHDRAFEQDHERILYTAMALIIGLAFVIFRGFSAIISTCSGPLIGVVWTLGWLAFLGEELNDLTQIIVPVMVMIIGFTDAVHIVVHVRQERAAGKNQREASATAIQHVGLACFLTSITTAIGFLSLLIADAEIIESFGRSSAIGVLMSFLAVVIVVPLLSGSWLGRNIHKGYERDLVGTNIQKLIGVVDWIVKHALLVTLAGVAVTAAMALGAYSLEPDDRLAHRIPHDCEEWQAMEHCDRAFGGIRFMRVLITWSDQQSREDIWRITEEVESRIGEEPLLGSALTVRHLLSVVPGIDGPNKLPLANLIPAELRTEFWNPDVQQTQVVSRMRDLGMATYRPILERMESDFRALENEYPGLKVEITGEALVESQVVQRVVRELFQSLSLAAIVIFLVITVAFRSLRLGLLSIVPNVFPLVATASLRAGFFGTSLDISSACSFAICLGIAVDDTIHFLIRFRHERAEGHDTQEAIRRSFITVGSALVMTTIVMVSGFGSVMTSHLPTHFLFASMAFTTIGAALIGDLIILPALLVQFPGGKHESPAEHAAESQEDGCTKNTS